MMEESDGGVPEGPRSPRGTIRGLHLEVERCVWTHGGYGDRERRGVATRGEGPGGNGVSRRRHGRGGRFREWEWE